ncbi:DinB family protein [Mucilaginibacter segetis]|uniref:DinB family protein n=1 Tax=Mucilaginibacter segetis TaxID=2793071 RepID=A0A934PND2_9SPHI|nr:DinB family protein [Mucilaginibacter segetis]MBK0377749.1 DinB family protein [Mucilaginibacter segetis]
MKMINFFFKQLEEESVTTRKMLERIPDDKYDWKPHEKSMTIRSLATHIAELPTWVSVTFTTDELDFAANAYAPVTINNTDELLDLFEKSLAEARMHLVPENEAKVDEIWTLRNGNEIYNRRAKWEVLRMTLSQIIHHRAQLGVYLRLLNIPIPGSYGPSADEQFEAIEVLAD